MSSVSNSASTIVCGSCSQGNSANDQYCSGCGQSMWEICPSCKGNAHIGQKFCNGCGHDLRAATAQRLEERQARLELAAKLGEQGKFDQAIRMAETVIEAPDYRFREQSEAAKSCVSSINAMREMWAGRLEGLPAQTAELLKQRQHAGIVELLKEVPDHLLSDDLRENLAQAQSAVQNAQQARTSLKAALAAKDWEMAMVDLVQLVDLFPRNEKYRELQAQVLDRIATRAKALISSGDHSAALKTLDAIPGDLQTSELQTQRETLEELVQLRKIVATSPFRTPFLANVIDRIGRLTPGDKLLSQMSAKFEKAKSTKPIAAHHLHQPWMKIRNGTFDRSLAPATLPGTIEGAKSTCLDQKGTRFWGAFGLATQALGHGLATANLLREKKGMLGKLGLKKKFNYESAWGLDIGDSSIKALRVSRKESGSFRIDDARLVALDRPTSEERGVAPKASSVFLALQKLLKEPIFEGLPVVANVSNTDLFARYFELPVDRPAKHDAFVMQETEANIPINFGLLATSYFTFPPRSESSVSQRSILLACRKTDVEARASMFSKCEANLVALVPEPLAYINAITATDYLGVLRNPSDAILVIDLGLIRSSIMIVTRSSAWYRTLDWGMDDVSQKFASNLQLSTKNADSVRSNLTKSETLNQPLSIMRDACVVPKRELDRSIHAAREQIGEFKIVEQCLTGGGAYQPLIGSFLNGETL